MLLDACPLRLSREHLWNLAARRAGSSFLNHVTAPSIALDASRDRRQNVFDDPEFLTPSREVRRANETAGAPGYSPLVNQRAGVETRKATG